MAIITEQVDEERARKSPIEARANQRHYDMAGLSA
jgi:hypothetical protein